MKRAIALAAALTAVFCPALAVAHSGEAVASAAPGWSFEPWVVVPMSLAAVLYVLGFVRLRARSSGGRAGLDHAAMRFAAGMLLLASAVVSPLHEAGARSFTAHMIEHEIMMLAAAPLLAASNALVVMLWSLPAGGRQALGALSRSGPVSGAYRGLTHPVSATVLQAAALWLWHAPSLFDRALASEGWHIAQHLCFLVAALVFWSAMFDRRLGAGVAALCLFATSVITGALGALMAVSESPWYAPYAALGMTPFGLTPAEDQQLAGVLMWAPGGMVHALVALALLAPALTSSLGKEGHRHVPAR